MKTINILNNFSLFSSDNEECIRKKIKLINKKEYLIE
jgi:hypothetical protein